MSIPEGHFDVLTAQIVSYRESLGSQSSQDDRLKYNDFARDYAKLEGQLKPGDMALFRKSAAVQNVFKELRLLKEAMASGATFPKRGYQTFTFTEVDQGLALSGTGSLLLSYGLRASYAAVAWPVSIAAFTILGGTKRFMILVAPDLQK